MLCVDIYTIIPIFFLFINKLVFYVQKCFYFNNLNMIDPVENQVKKDEMCESTIEW